MLFLRHLWRACTRLQQTIRCLRPGAQFDQRARTCAAGGEAFDGYSFSGASGLSRHGDAGGMISLQAVKICCCFPMAFFVGLSRSDSVVMFISADMNSSAEVTWNAWLVGLWVLMDSASNVQKTSILLSIRPEAVRRLLVDLTAKPQASHGILDDCRKNTYIAPPISRHSKMEYPGGWFLFVPCLRPPTYSIA